MKRIKISKSEVIINVEDGVDATKQPLSGTCCISSDLTKVEFTQEPVQVFKNTKNPVIYNGKYMKVRYHPRDGASQLTMRLSLDTNIDEIRGVLVNEFVNAVDKWLVM